MSSDLTSLLQPIPGDAPAGASARYDPVFLRLEAEIAKLGAIDGSPVDWTQVANDATEILTSTSKDLLAAVYLGRAWYQLHGAAGLRDGLTVIADVVTTYWDAGFPPLARLRARRAALQWLSDGLGGMPTDTDPEVVNATLQVVDQINDHLQPHFDDGDTGLNGLRNALRQLLNPGASEKSSRTSSKNAGTQTFASAASSPSAGGVAIDREEAMRCLQTAAAWFLAIEPHSPVGYLAQRAADLGGKPFHAVFRELLANHQPAQQELWHVLGIPAEPGI